MALDIEFLKGENTRTRKGFKTKKGEANEQMIWSSAFLRQSIY